MSEKINIAIRGVAGDCVAINDYRVAGPKPGIGGRVVQEWVADKEDILDAFRTPDERHERLHVGEGKPQEMNQQIKNALVDFFESQQQADADFVGEQRAWHLPRLNRAAKNFMLLFPIESAAALGQIKTSYDELAEGEPPE